MSANDETVQAEDAKKPEETDVTVEETTEETQSADAETSGESAEETEQQADKAEPQKEERKPRPVHTMPVAKAQKEKQKAVEKAQKETEERLRAEFEQKLAANTDKGDDDIEKFAEESGLDPELTRKLVEKARPDMSKYEPLLEDKARSDKEQEIAEAKRQVTSDFDEKVKSQILERYPEATPEHVEEVRKGLEELAFTEEFAHYPLEHVYAVNASKFEFKNSLGAETPSGNGSQPTAFKRLSDEEQNALAANDPAAYERYVKWEEGQQSSYS
jgi:hypothetical protein